MRKGSNKKVRKGPRRIQKQSDRRTGRRDESTMEEWSSEVTVDGKQEEGTKVKMR